MPQQTHPTDPTAFPIDPYPYEIEPRDEGAHNAADDGDVAGMEPDGDGPVGMARPYLPAERSVVAAGVSSTQMVPAAPVALTPPPLPVCAGQHGHAAYPARLAAPHAHGGPMIVAPPREGCSIASAICGITGFVPFISQAAGLALGIAGLVRINRARRRGVPMRGVGWAVTGLSTSVFGLLCWLGVLGGMFFLRSTIEQATSGLDVLNLPVK